MKPFCNGVSRLRARLCGHRAGIPATHTIPNTGKKALLGLLLLTLSPVASAAAQERRPVYFVDGYHGGIYGHYPVEWKTRFIVDELEAHPEWRIGLEIEPETWDTVALRTPADYARFKRIAADPRVEFTNPTYAQPYCYNISGESIIRQFAYGIRKIRSHFPDVEFVTYSVEEPCFTSSLPQILRLFGFKYASLKCPNTCWGGYTAPYGGELVNWTAPDGTSILTSPRYACEELQPNSVWQTTAWGNETPYIEACIRQDIAHPVGMCYQDAGWRYGPWIGSGDSIRNNSIYVTWREYFERISEGRTTDDYRFPQEDMHVSLMWGSQVMQRIAREVRRAENSLSTAEKMGAIANLSNGYLYKQGDHGRSVADADARPAPRFVDRTLQRPARQRDLGRPHPPLDGGHRFDLRRHRRRGRGKPRCGRKRQEGVRHKGLQHARHAAPRGGPRRAARRIRRGGGRRAGHPREEGRQRPHDLGRDEEPALRGRGSRPSATRPTLSGKAVRRRERKPRRTPRRRAASSSKTTCTASRSTPHAAASSRASWPSTSAAGNMPTPGSDYALGELRGHFYEEGRFRSSTETPAEVSVLCDNDLEKRIRIRGAIASHPFTETITLRKGDRKIDFDLRIDWKHNVGIGEFAQKDAFNKNRRAFYDSRYKLNIYFPVALDAPELYKDAPFDVCKSRLKDTRFSTWDNIKHDILLHWADLAERDGGYGLALLTDHTTSYIYGGGSPLGLTVQYSGGGLWGRDYPIDPSDAHPLRRGGPRRNVGRGGRPRGEPPLERAAALRRREHGRRKRLAHRRRRERLRAVGRLSPGGKRHRAPVQRLGRRNAADRAVRLPRVEDRGDRPQRAARRGSCDAAVRDGETEVRVAMPRFGLKTFRLTK